MTSLNKRSSRASLFGHGAILAGCLFAASAHAATVSSAPFGRTTAGDAVRAYTMTNAHGLQVTVMTYGGVITQILVPGRDGTKANVVLGYDTLADYEAHSRKDGTFFGALIGRYANRIAKGHFSLDGQDHSVPVNDHENSLHGGAEGFDRRIWSAKELPRSGGKAGIVLSMTSPDGDQGYPGALHVVVTYTLSDDDSFGIDYVATTTKSTVLNLTNHSYFNLAGAGSQNGILDQMLQVDASRYTPTNASLIPTGELAPVAGTPFDFTTAKPIGRDIRTPNAQLLYAHGYDHNWVVNGATDQSGAHLTLRPVATIWDPVSGRRMRVASTEPGVQIYTSNFLIGDGAGRGQILRQSDAVTFETQHFPDSPNQPSFPSTRLDPGQTFHSQTRFTFDLSPAAGPR